MSLTTATRAGSSKLETADRKQIIGIAMAVALITTAGAYVGMVGFGHDVLQMPLVEAYAFAGAFELSMMAAALMAREAIRHDRPAQIYLTCTWIFSAISGLLSASHEVLEGHAGVAAVFRLLMPLTAALMWHFALVGDRHLAMDRSVSEIRNGLRVHTMLLLGEDLRRALLADDGSRAAARRIARAERRLLRSRKVTTRNVPPAVMRRTMKEWTEALGEADRGLSVVSSGIDQNQTLSPRALTTAEHTGTKRGRALPVRAVVPTPALGSTAGSSSRTSMPAPRQLRPAPAREEAPATAITVGLGAGEKARLGAGSHAESVGNPTRRRSGRSRGSAAATESDQTTPRRAVNLLAQGATTADVADILGVPVTRVEQWSTTASVS